MDRPVILVKHQKMGELFLDIEHPPGVPPAPVVLSDPWAMALIHKIRFPNPLEEWARIPADYIKRDDHV